MQCVPIARTSLPNIHTTIPGLSLCNSSPSLQINFPLITLYTLKQILIKKIGD